MVTALCVCSGLIVSAGEGRAANGSTYGGKAMIRLWPSCTEQGNNRGFDPLGSPSESVTAVEKFGNGLVVAAVRSGQVVIELWGLEIPERENNEVSDRGSP